MSLFHKMVLTDLDTVIVKCQNLSRNLNYHYEYPFEDSHEEWLHRSRIFDESRIHEFSANTYTNVRGQFIPDSIKYKICEKVGPVQSFVRTSEYRAPFFIPIENPYRFSSDPNVVYITLMDGPDLTANCHITVRAVTPESVYLKKYSGIQVGDMINIDSPIVVMHSHTTNDPDFGGFFMHFQIYLSLK